VGFLNSDGGRAAPAARGWPGGSSSMALLLAATVFLAVYLQQPPAAVPASAPAADFSSERALRHLRAVAQRPRPTGSAESEAARAYISAELAALGLDPQVQTAFALYPDRGSPYNAATVRNVVARLAGSGGEGRKAVLLAAHYDSVPAGPGANDDGVGVATLLETARALKSGPPPANDVIFLVTDGEELGLLGARAFAAEHPWARRVGVALNFEARGNGGPVMMFETTKGNAWMIEEFAAAAPDPVANSLSYEVYKRMPNDTDLSVFKKAGLPGMNFAYIGGLTHYHTASDNLLSVSERSLQHHGGYALALARRFGSAGLDGRGQSDAVYFNLFGPLLVSYGAWLALPLAALAVLLYAGVLALGFRRGLLTLKGVVFGALALAASCAAAAAAVTLVWRLARPLHRGYESTPWGDPFAGRFYVLALALLAVAVVAALYNWFRRRTGVWNLTAGALLWWVLLAVGVSLSMPGASYLPVWPLLCALAGTAALFVLPERDSTARGVVLALTAVTGVALFAPLVPQVFDGLTLNVAGPVAVLLALVCGLLVPHSQVLAGAKPWVFPVAAAALCVALITGGLLAAGAGAGRPPASNVLYGLNADTGKALWGSADRAPDAWTAQFFPPGTGRERLAEFFPTADASATFLSAAAPPATLPAPEVSLLEETREGETRTLRLRVSSPRRAPLVSIYTESDGELLQAKVNGQEVPTARQQGRPWGVRYHAFPEEGAELVLRVRSAGPLVLRVNDLSRELPGDVPFRPRPPQTPASPQDSSEATVVSRSFKF
jgi:hypothetical protein